jgi:hypothetical protein
MDGNGEVIGEGEKLLRRENARGIGACVSLSDCWRCDDARDGGAHSHLVKLMDSRLELFLHVANAAPSVLG